MKFLADMGISQKTIHWLKKQGYDAVHLREQGLQRISDPMIVKKGRVENRIILTFDLDFGAIMANSTEVFPSIIIFRLDDETPANINKRLTVVLEESSELLAQGAIIIVEETRHRIRLLPIYKV